MNMIGHPEIPEEDYRDYQIPSTYAPKGSRSEWIGKHAWQFPPGEYHLHARYLKGEIMWVLSSRGSPICKIEGRCKKVNL